MATYTWNTGSGDFATPTNWTPAGPPGTADTALFNASSGTITGAGSVAVLDLFGAGPWSWAGTLTANNYNINDTVTLSTGAAWTLAGTPTNSNYMVIGSGSGGVGSVTVTNGASIASTQSASTTAYGLYVASGTAANATGTLTVGGAGSSVSTGANGAAVGFAGTGVLTVQSGATATFASSDSSQIAALSVGNAGSGTVNVTGSGSALTAGGFVYVGRGGAGALNVSAGATFTGGAAASGSVPAFGIDIGDSTSATATTQRFGGTATATVSSGGTLSSLGNLDVGLSGSTGTLTVDGSASIATAAGAIGVGGGTTRTGASGTLTVQNGGTVRAGTPSTGNAAIAIGTGMAGQTGTATVTGTGSLLDANGYRLSIGTGATVPGVAQSGGTGTLTVSNGGRVLSGANYSDTEAALAVGVYASGVGTLTITGSGSQLIANGAAVIGGGNSGSGVTKGGTGTVSVASGGLLQTGAMTIFGGSSLTVDQTSTLTTPTIAISGGTADLFTLTNATAVSFSASGLLRVHAVTGANTVGNFTFGDEIDFAGTTAVTLSGNTLTTSTGSITLATQPANASYQLIGDGNGGVFVALEPQTIGVYRFFDTKFGTHFYTADANEAATIRATRTDLTPEGPGGIGLQAVAVSASDPNAAAVYRFFDTLHGTHFFTASATERDSLIASRSDLIYEASSTFYEHTAQQPGDIPVYRFFDNVYGTHFYTDNATEYANIRSTRADLVYEAIGFYEPPKNAANAPV